MAIQFLKGTSASFNAAGFTPISDVFYFLTDTNDFYIGSQKLTNAKDLLVAVENIAQNASDIADITARLNKLEADENTDGSIRNIIREYLDDIDVEDPSKAIYLDDSTPTSGTNYSKIYKLYQGSDSSDMSKNTLIGSIEIPLDLFVSKGVIKTVVTDGEPYTEAKVGDKYIELTLANATQDKLYIPADSLVDVYKAKADATQVQIAIDPSTNEISAMIVGGSIGTTELADGGVTASKLSNDAKALFDEAGAAATVLGSPTDDADTISVYGAIAKASSVELTWGSFNESL